MRRHATLLGMKLRGALVLTSFALALTGCAGRSGIRTLPNAPAESPAARTPAAASTIPYFTSTFKAQGQMWSFAMVGTDPRSSRVTTTVTAHVVPVKLTFSNGMAFDATSLAPGVVRSPLFNSAQFIGGNMQFGDAVMRGEFWKYVSSNSTYHVLLSAVPVEPTVSVAVPSADGYTAPGAGGQYAYVTYAWFVQTIEPQLIAQLGIPPTDLTIFVTSRTSVLEPGGHCCYLGYHSVFPIAGAAGTRTWTTAWASVTSKNIEALSHEVAEWLNDPFYNNTVPSWLSPESGACGGKQLEVGDPLTEYRIRRGGFVLQDIAFFSWFARQKPSIGYKRRYDLAGKLSSPAQNCPP